MEIGSSSSQPLLIDIAPSRLDHNTDFSRWRIDMDKILQDNNVRYVLMEPKPPEPTTKSPEADVDRHLKWSLDDFRARHLIHSALHQHVYTSYHCHETAKSLMDALTAYFKTPPVRRKATKLRRYMDQKMTEGKSIEDQVYEMRAMAAELEIEGVKVSEKLQTLMLVNSLPERLHLAVMDRMSSADSLETISMRFRQLSSKRLRHQSREEMAEINDTDIVIKVARQIDFFDQIGRNIYFDLVDHEKVAASFRVPRMMPIYLFKEKLARVCGVPVQFQRLWLWAKRNNTYRPERPLEPKEEIKPVGLHCKSKAELNLFLEVQIGKNDNFIALPERTDLILLFFKLYDPVQEKVRYVGSHFVKSTSTPDEILVILKRLAGYYPSEEINLYQEFMFEPRVLCFPINMTATFQESKVMDGDIIWFQKAIPDEDYVHFRNPNVPSFLDYIHGSLVVQFRDLNNHTQLDFSLNLVMLDTYDRVVELVAQQLGLDDPSKIRLTSHNYNLEKPQSFPIKYRGVKHLKEMLAENYNTSYILYYEKLDIPLPQLQDLNTLRVTFRHPTTVEVVTHTISLPNPSIVRDVLDDLRYKVQLSHPDAVLRLFEIFSHKIYRVYPHHQKIEKIHNRIELWAEEVPEEENTLGPNDRLIQVCHFHRKTVPQGPQQMIENFGAPFLLVIHKGETLAEIRARIQHKLHIPDEEFQKWRFAVISLGKVRNLHGSELISRYFQKREICGVYEEYLGMEHQESEHNKQQLTRHDSHRIAKRLKVGSKYLTIFRSSEAPSTS